MSASLTISVWQHSRQGKPQYLEKGLRVPLHEGPRTVPYAFKTQIPTSTSDSEPASGTTWGACRTPARFRTSPRRLAVNGLAAEELSDAEETSSSRSSATLGVRSRRGVAWRPAGHDAPARHRHHVRSRARGGGVHGRAGRHPVKGDGPHGPMCARPTGRLPAVARRQAAGGSPP